MQQHGSIQEHGAMWKNSSCRGMHTAGFYVYIVQWPILNKPQRARIILTTVQKNIIEEKCTEFETERGDLNIK